MSFGLLYEPELSLILGKSIILSFRYTISKFQQLQADDNRLRIKATGTGWICHPIDCGSMTFHTTDVHKWFNSSIFH